MQSRAPHQQRQEAVYKLILQQLVIRQLYRDTLRLMGADNNCIAANLQDIIRDQKIGVANILKCSALHLQTQIDQESNIVLLQHQYAIERCQEDLAGLRCQQVLNTITGRLL